MKYVFFLLLLLPFSLLGQSKLSEHATFSLLTCGPGADLYAAFGHSAIRIHDPIRGTNKVYNYGTFDFNTPNFYLKFVRGQLLYKLGVGNYKSFVYTYKQHGRSMDEEEILLSKDQKEQLFAFLENNAKPENASYQYDFFYDNCATRIYDVLKVVLGDSLIFEDTSLEKNETYRELLQPYIDHMPWIDFGIDLALGAPTDKKAGFFGRMFLPDYLQTGLQTGRLLGGNGQKRPLLGPVKSLLPATIEFEKPTFWETPAFPFWLLALASFILTFFFPNRKFTRIFATVLFVVVGIIGLNVAFLMFATEHVATAKNLNIVWANPLFLLLVFWPSFKYTRALRRFLLFALLVLIAAWFFWVQDLHGSVFPIVLTMTFRLFPQNERI